MSDQPAPTGATGAAAPTGVTTPTAPTGASGPTQQSLTAALAAFLIDKNMEIFTAYLKANPPIPVKKAEGDWTSDTAGGFPQPGTVQEIDAKWYEGKITDEERDALTPVLRQAWGAQEAAQPAPAEEPPPAQG
jgi:hypothetical protein